MNEFIINLDTEIFLWLNSFHSLYWDVVMKMASGKFVWLLLYFSLAYALGRTFGWKVAVVYTLMAALAVVMADQISASILRPMFERLRPANLDNPISGFVHVVGNYRGGKYGFPSCHAANTFAVATLMTMLFKKWRFGIFIFLWAALNCYSRIYLGVHYPGDLLAGFVIGCICGVITYYIGIAISKTVVMRVKERSATTLRFSLTEGGSSTCRPCDIPIWTGVITAVYILLCASAII